MNTLTVHRYPNKATLMRGPNMLAKFCNKCRENKTHGFWLYDDSITKQAIFVCDGCLNETRKSARN